jgi:hypothetical protein
MANGFLHIVAALALLGAGCPNDDMGPEPFLPEDYAATYTEVRDCRQSGDHDLHVVRVLADPVALAAYADRSEPFPAGAIVVKEEYGFGDVDCSGSIEQWTVMEKLEVGSDPENLDWLWQTIDADRTVKNENEPRCAICHTICGVPPDGYDGTCTVP